MSLKALITTIVLASSATVAAADPMISFSARGSWSTSAPTVRDHRSYQAPQYQAPQYQPQYQAPLYQVKYRPRFQAVQSVVVRDSRTNASWEVTPCHDAINLNGHYTSKDGDIDFVQRGNRIFGTFAEGGRLQGVLENGRITFTWTQGGGYGQGIWYVDARGQVFGTWGHNESVTSGGSWNLVAQR
jgi:hypothetical protein